MNQTIRIALLGPLIWVVPFVLGFFFYDENGNLSADIFLFKSVMIISLTLVTAFANHAVILRTHGQFLRTGMISGFIWLLVPLLLDVLVLIPMTGLTATEYFFQIGLRYLVIPIITISSSLLLDRKLAIKN